MFIDEGGKGGDGGKGGVYFLILFFEHDAEVFIEEDGDFEDIHGVESEAFLAEDRRRRGDRCGGVEFEAFIENLDEFCFSGCHAE